MTTGFGTQQMPDTTIVQPISQIRLFSEKMSCADGCLHRPTSGSRQLGILAFFLGIQIMSWMLNFLGRNHELPIGNRRSAHDIRCGVASTRGVGSSFRTSKIPQRVQSYREMLYVTL